MRVNKRRLKVYSRVFAFFALVFIVSKTICSYPFFAANHDINFHQSSDEFALKSEITCRQHACLIRNLHIRDGFLEVYVSKSDDLQVTRIMSGIGAGSGHFHFISSANISAWNSTSSLAQLNREGLIIFLNQKNESKSFSLPIVIHYGTYPAPAGSAKIQIISEPTVFYSLLWSNFFRTVYASYAAYYSLLDYKLYFQSHFKVLLIDRPPLPHRFIEIVNAVVPTKVMKSDDILFGHYIFRAAIVGLSQDALISEIVVDRGQEWRFTLRERALKIFASTLKRGLLNNGKWKRGAEKYSHNGNLISNDSRQWGMRSTLQWAIKRFYSYFQPHPHRAPRVTLLLREPTASRQIKNSDSLISALANLDISLKVHQNFAHIPLKAQLSIISSTDIFITMHGAAVTHLLFLPSNACVVELFPYAFKKAVYLNLARSLGVGYLSWQNSKLSKTLFPNPNAFHQVTDREIESIKRLPIDWYNMDSKNWWRNQDTVVDVQEITGLIKFAADDWKQKQTIRSQTKYLMYMPWEQFNNQIIGFKSACAMAAMLNRTLVLPFLGYRNPNATNNRENFIEFSPSQFLWRPFEHYFDLASLYTHSPCSFITHENFISHATTPSTKITLRYHHLGQNITSERQMRDYYTNVGRIPVDSLKWDRTYFHLTRDEIIKAHGDDDARVLALGSLFWYFDFGVSVQYPLTRYTNYIRDGDIMYASISQGLVFHERVLLDVKDGMRATGMESGGYVSVHIRRGDYHAKCNDLANAGENLKDRCLTNLKYVQLRLLEAVPDPNARKTLYVSTNAGYDEIIMISSILGQHWDRVLFQKDLKMDAEFLGFGRDRAGLVVGAKDDGVDACMYDQKVCAESHIFVGNMYSSFSRHIIDMRTLNGLESLLF